MLLLQVDRLEIGKKLTDRWSKFWRALKKDGTQYVLSMLLIKVFRA
jgi:hypothetical protein